MVQISKDKCKVAPTMIITIERTQVIPQPIEQWRSILMKQVHRPPRAKSDAADNKYSPHLMQLNGMCDPEKEWGWFISQKTRSTEDHSQLKDGTILMGNDIRYPSKRREDDYVRVVKKRNKTESDLRVRDKSNWDGQHWACQVRWNLVDKVPTLNDAGGWGSDVKMENGEREWGKARQDGNYKGNKYRKGTWGKTNCTRGKVV